MAGVPLEAELEPDRMTDAPEFKSGKTFCTVKMVPPTLRLNVSRKCCGVISANGANSPPPALVNTTSRPCPCALTASATLSTSSESVTSPQIPLAEGPIDASASSRRCLSRPVMKTCAPSAASRLAAARPIPDVPPVTSAVLPLSCPMMVLHFYLFSNGVDADDHCDRLMSHSAHGCRHWRQRATWVRSRCR